MLAILNEMKFVFTSEKTKDFDYPGDYYKSSRDKAKIFPNKIFFKCDAGKS